MSHDDTGRPAAPRRCAVRSSPGQPLRPIVPYPRTRLMGAGDWAPEERRETRIAGTFALVLAIAVMAYAGLGSCSV